MCGQLAEPPAAHDSLLFSKDAQLFVGRQRVRSSRINAINCRHVPAWLNPQARVVTVEVIHDGNNPIPVQPYYCDPGLLTTELFPAPALRHVRPYAPPPAPPLMPVPGPPGAGGFG